MAFDKKAWRKFIPFPRRRTLRRWFPSFETRKLVNLIKNARADLVVDVGANYGQYVTAIRSAGWQGPIISIEPLEDAHRHLVEISRSDRYWRVFERMAVGAVNSEARINHFHDSSMSSLLVPNQRTASNRSLQLSRTESTPIRRLDEALRDEEVKRIFLKIDVQGTELDVLSGAEGLLPNIKAIQIELALQQIYDGEPRYIDVLQRLDALNFTPVFFLPVISRSRLDPDCQTDMVAFHRSLLDGD